MAALGKPIGRLPRRALGYERLRRPRAFAKTANVGGVRKVKVLEAVLPTTSACLAAATAGRGASVAGARTSGEECGAPAVPRGRAWVAEEPRWHWWYTRLSAPLSLDGELRMADSGGVGVPGMPAARQGSGGCARVSAGSSCVLLWRPSSRLWPGSRKSRDGLDGLQRRTTSVRSDMSQLAELARNVRILERRLTDLVDVAEGLARRIRRARAARAAGGGGARCGMMIRTVGCANRQYGRDEAHRSCSNCTRR